MLRKPLGVNVDEACNLYVVDATLKTVMKYRKDGTFIAALGGKDWFDRPSHVAASPDGARVYAVDTGGVDSQNHRIRVFDTQSGEHLYDIGTRGKETGQFNLPRDIEMGDDGRLYIVDGANFRVQVLEQDGTPVLAFGGIGRQFGQFSRPKGIGIDPNGNIYVSDATFGNFQIFNTEGQLLLFVGGRSTTPARAQYMLPAGLHVDEDGRVYMVDQFFRKIDIFRPAALAQDDGYLGAWYRSPEASDSGNK
jgi:DNA-binding beta-propeller fold protein YncE